VSSRSGVATLRTAIHLLLTYYLYEQYRPAKLLCPGCRQNSGEVSQLLYCYCCCYTLVTYLLTFNELMTSVRPYTVCTCSGSLRVSLLLPVYFCLCRPSGRLPEQLCFRRLCLSVYICVHACVWSESLQTGLQSTSSLILISYGELL